MSGQKDLQKQSLHVMKDMTCRYEYDSLMRDIPIYDGKNMELADWLLQIEKVTLLANSQECELAKAKLTSTPYRMLKGIGKDRIWQDIKK